MTEEERKAADKARMDAEGEKLDKVLSALDGLCARMDAMEADKARRDAEAEKAAKDASKKDDGEPEDKDKPERVAADARKDNEEDIQRAKADAEEAKKEAEEAKADAASVRQMIADLQSQLPKQISDQDYAALADAQAKADRTYQAFGDSAPRPLNGETVAGYEKRVINDLKRHSARWKDADIYALQDSVLQIAKSDVYSDAMAAARRPSDLGPGMLRPVYKTNELTGTRIIEFVGNGTFIGGMKRPSARVKSIEARKPLQ